MKSYQIFNLNNKLISSDSIALLYDFFIQLNIPLDLRNNILEKVNSEIDFEISVPELIQLQIAATEKIDALILDENFDPNKERLRRLYPQQYSSNPLIWKGKTLYIYMLN